MRKVDFHSHILPGVDHGSDGIETSMNQLRHAIEVGVTDIVCTPHFYHNRDTIDEFVERRARGYNLLNSEIQRLDLPIKLHLAAEVNLQIDLLKLDTLDPLKIEGTNYILMELPWGYTPEWYLKDLDFVRDKYHLVSIIAHVDRISRARHEDIFKKGYPVQVNASAFRKLADRHYYMKQILSGNIHLLGSDAHGNGEEQYKDFKLALSRVKKVRGFCENALDILPNH